MPRAYVSIGSNIERRKHIAAGLAALRQRYGDIQLSSIYETAAEGFDGAPFFNLVVAFDTDEPAGELNGQLKTMEIHAGRVRSGKKFSSRTLDLDLLLYGDAIIKRPDLNLPRDEIDRYAFVLQPLAELAPEMRHPGQDKSFAAMWREARTKGYMQAAQVADWKLPGSALLKTRRNQ